jgi:hypothetical protein
MIQNREKKKTASRIFIKEKAMKNRSEGTLK